MAGTSTDGLSLGPCGWALNDPMSLYTSSIRHRLLFSEAATHNE